MSGRDTRDILTGLVFLALGLAAAAYAAATLRLGTFRAMGPGMFPLLIGLVMAGLGAAIAAPAARRAAPERPALWGELRAAVAVLASIAIFAATMRQFGLVPASLLLVLISMLAMPGGGAKRFLQGLVLALVISALAWLVFVLGLGVALQPFSWPF